MKNILLVCLLFAACRSTTESRLNAKAAAILKRHFINDKERLEEFKIDSFRYKACDQARFYSSNFESFLTLDKLGSKVNQMMVALYAISRNDSARDRVLGDERAINEEENQIHNLIENADTAENYYEINAHIIAKTDKQSYSENRQIFVDKSTLEEAICDKFKILGKSRNSPTSTETKSVIN